MLMKFPRFVAAAALPLILSGCFLVPGAFTSNLDLRRSGDFTFAYNGEVVFQSPDDIIKGDSPPEVWDDANAYCPPTEEAVEDAASASAPFSENTSQSAATKAKDAADAAKAASVDDSNAEVASCTKAQIATQHKEWDERQKESALKKQKDGAQFAAMFGFNPSDDDANRKFAATLMRYDGWKSVSYRGKGVFDVNYQLAGKIGHDFIFPLFPQNDVIIPFVSVRKRDKGSVMVNAPALIGGGMKALAARAKAMGAPAEKGMPGSSMTKGTFTLTTDGEILTNNTEDGATKTTTGRQLVWDINPTSERVPEALIRLQP